MTLKPETWSPRPQYSLEPLSPNSQIEMGLGFKAVSPSLLNLKPLPSSNKNAKKAFRTLLMIVALPFTPVDSFGLQKKQVGWG